MARHGEAGGEGSDQGDRLVQLQLRAGQGRAGQGHREAGDQPSGVPPLPGTGQAAGLLQGEGHHHHRLLPPRIPRQALGQARRPLLARRPQDQGHRRQALQVLRPGADQVAGPEGGDRHPKVGHAHQDRGERQHLRLPTL